MISSYLDASHSALGGENGRSSGFCGGGGGGDGALGCAFGEISIDVWC